MVTSADLSAELFQRVHRRVDFAPERPLRLRQRLHDFTEGDIPHDQQVDVAVIAQLVARRRAEHEGDANAIRQRQQGLSHDVHQAGRLHEQRLQFGKHRR